MYLQIQNFLNSARNRNILFTFLAVFIFFLSKNFGMFDDDILFGSKMGNQLYYNSIFNWTMPDSFDPGHPPFLGTILAIFWEIFGHHLWVSHLAMVPFTIGFFIQLYKFISYCIPNNSILQILAFILLIVDPTLSTCLALSLIHI